MYRIEKLDPEGNLVFTYPCETLFKKLTHGLVLSTSWSLPARDLGYVTFDTGDLFVEYFYTDRWFNIFQISSPHGQLKGWYCNFAEPCEIKGNCIQQKDLFLDLWVSPLGKTLLLDEDEFEAATLSPFQRTHVKQAVNVLHTQILTHQEPFTVLARM